MMTLTELTELDVFDNLPQLGRFLNEKLKYTDKPSKLLILLYIVCSSLLLFDQISTRVLAFYGFIVPAYKTLSALEYKDHEAERFMLIYWITYVLIIALNEWIFFIPSFVQMFIIFKLYNNNSKWALKIFKFYDKFCAIFSDTIKAKVDGLKYYMKLYTDPLVEIMTTEIYFRPDENAQAIKIKKD